ncbi:FAD-dependent monooxygenase [Lacimicrobium alkaliphilum]|uniref:2-octaprenyl-6-methoxyphenol hydroxylase n=1 Tax=Lacimicrobium alkaliphilum TaxID=1526571 RepID=A0ABQ1QY82_9ALTE|nr:FAD-dependent monooxygenase [Lacimicrobium alkaliphilum]GGD49797.1 2-octaprenyl-6-methoxyphenol hydroxylase [Lacimicrobium alkaliphilum]
MQQADVVIVGGGLAGLSLAVSLADSSVKVVVVDEKMPYQAVSQTPGVRVSAINQASEELFRELGIWQHLDEKRVQPYTHMQVWEQDSFASIEFDHQSVCQSHLGHIIENQLLINALWEKLLEASNIQIEVSSAIEALKVEDERALVRLANGQQLAAKLVVGADGIHSKIRTLSAMPLSFSDYQQSAIVANVQTELVHQQCARQVFTPYGPLAFLPMTDPHLCSIVWSVENKQADELMVQSPGQFAKALYRAFDGKLGLCELVSERKMFPLTMRYARQWLKHRVVLAGDAAHSIHPLAGQGANLGLMDVRLLSEVLLDLTEAGKDIGTVSSLRVYERTRKAEAVKMIAAMQGFRSLFAGSNPMKKALRGMGLSLANKMPLAKRRMMLQAAGL